MIVNSISASKLADYLLKIKAIKLNTKQPYTWSSGWKSPIYCDNRITLSYPQIRSFIKKEIALAIKDQFPDTTALCGVATAGIAIGGLAADELGLPFAYCRPKPKEHGLKNQLEGHLFKNHQIVVVEDLISTGGSSLKVVEYLRNEGYNVLGMASIFTYGFDIADQNFQKAACEIFSLSDLSTLLHQAKKSNYINAEEMMSIEQWRKDPSVWK
ncbi:MAG: orotate phosphoribosyltransferase [Bacteroidia bacterium]|jgi:orotate phosphoribosyltransferase